MKNLIFFLSLCMALGSLFLDNWPSFWMSLAIILLLIELKEEA